MKKIFLILLSLFIIISLCEIFLIIYGPYNYIAKAKFKKSISWYERPSNFTQQQPHPDLIYNIENYFDKNGIKNCKNNKTVNEKNLIGHCNSIKLKTGFKFQFFFFTKFF